jgi:hypothetical protein
LSRTSDATHGHRTDSATKAAIQIVGLPEWASWTLHGFVRQKARIGHVHGAGRSRTSVHPTISAGMANHRTTGRTVNGTNRSRATGG